MAVAITRDAQDPGAATAPAGLGPLASRRLLQAHVAEYLRARGRPLPREAALWQHGQPADDLRIDEEGLGLDSLARLDLVAQLTRAFDLQTTGIEDHLILRPELGAWAELVATHFRLAPEGGTLTFRTSGSTRSPRRVRHAVADLVAEADAHAGSVLGRAGRADPGRVIALVPAHHIYGAIFTALLPERLGAPVVDLADAPPSALVRAARAGDLVVGTPFAFAALLEAVAHVPQDLDAVISTAPMPPGLWPRMIAAGFRSITEIYGATETAGLATRRSEDADLALLPHLSRTEAGEILSADGTPLDLQDRLVWTGPRRFRVAGRRDGAVQVGGVNVDPAETRATLLAQPGVAEAAVRLEGDRLQAFVVPDTGVQGAAESLATALHRALAETLAPAARPETIAIGPALPRDRMGKIAPWPLPV